MFMLDSGESGAREVLGNDPEGAARGPRVCGEVGVAARKASRSWVSRDRRGEVGAERLLSVPPLLFCGLALARGDLGRK